MKIGKKLFGNIAKFVIANQGSLINMALEGAVAFKGDSDEKRTFVKRMLNQAQVQAEVEFRDRVKQALKQWDMPGVSGAAEEEIDADITELMVDLFRPTWDTHIEERLLNVL